MSKFCFRCKLELDDNTNSCPQCNNIVEAQIPVLEAVEPVAEKAFNYGKLNKILFKTAGIGMIVLLILLFINIAVAISQKPEERTNKNDKGYLKPIDTMIEGVLNADADKFLSAFADFKVDIMQYRIDDDYLKEKLNGLKYAYGENVKLTFKVIDENQLDKDNLEYWNNYIKERRGKEVTDGYELEIEMKTSGNKDSNEEEQDVTVLKIDGKWCIVDFDGMY